jgi:hypothetical protein
MRIPSASFCHRLANVLSSVSAVFEYMLKRAPELSPKLGPFLDGRRPCSRYAGKFGGYKGVQEHTHVACLSPSLSHAFCFTTCATVLENVVRYGGKESLKDSVLDETL